MDYAVIFVAINLASFPKILNDTHYMVNISINATDIPLAISALNQEDPKVMAPNDIVSMTQSPSDSSDATFVMQNSNEAIDRYNIIIIIDLHDNSGADKVNVTVMSEEGMIMTGNLCIVLPSYILKFLLCVRAYISVIFIEYVRIHVFRIYICFCIHSYSIHYSPDKYLCL